MIRNLKVLGMALIAACSLGALTASAALAVEDNGAFVCENASGTATTCNIHGEQVVGEKHVFNMTTAGGVTHKTECTTATFTGTVTGGTSSTLEVHPTYSGCSAFGLSSTVTTTGCNFLIHITKTLANATDYDGDVDIVCEAGKSIVINAGFGECEVKIDGQTGLRTVEAINMTNPTTVQNDVTLKWNLSEISYTVTKDGPFCPLSGTGTFGSGDLTGNTTVTATEDVVGGAALGTKIEMGAIT